MMRGWEGIRAVEVGGVAAMPLAGTLLSTWGAESSMSNLPDAVICYASIGISGLTRMGDFDTLAST